MDLTYTRSGDSLLRKVLEGNWRERKQEEDQDRLDNGGRLGKVERRDPTTREMTISDISNLFDTDRQPEEEELYSI